MQNSSVPLSGSRRRFPTKPSGVVAMELLLVSPFVLFLLLIIFEMGLLFSNMQQVQNAAFSAAREAATFSGGKLSDPEVIEQVRMRVDRTLQSGGLG